jgi:hypothetical protein
MQQGAGEKREFEWIMAGTRRSWLKRRRIAVRE